MQRNYYRACDRKGSASLTMGVSRGPLGFNAKTTISSLSGFFINSKRKVQQILSSIFNLNISLSLVSKTEHRVSKDAHLNMRKWRKNWKKPAYRWNIAQKSRRKRLGWVITTKRSDTSKDDRVSWQEGVAKFTARIQWHSCKQQYAAYNYFSLKIDRYVGHIWQEILPRWPGAQVTQQQSICGTKAKK